MAAAARRSAESFPRTAPHGCAAWLGRAAARAVNWHVRLCEAGRGRRGLRSAEARAAAGTGVCVGGCVWVGVRRRGPAAEDAGVAADALLVAAGEDVEELVHGLVGAQHVARMAARLPRGGGDEGRRLGGDGGANGPEIAAADSHHRVAMVWSYRVVMVAISLAAASAGCVQAPQSLEAARGLWVALPGACPALPG
jgi:hypothetical protein